MDISGLAVTLDSGPVTSNTGMTLSNNSTSDFESIVVLPGGVILQFGYLYDNGSNPKSVTFQTAFPTALLSAGCSTLRGSAGGSGFGHVTDLKLTGMKMQKKLLQKLTLCTQIQVVGLNFMVLE